MSAANPHYLLFSETDGAGGPGHWRFVLRSTTGTARLEAFDTEPRVRGERLELLTVVRALESLDQPSEVTLVGCSRHIQQGVQFGLSEWRDNNWRWEFFGQMVPVKDRDLWERIDRALQFHRVECVHRRFDSAHETPAGPAWAGNQRETAVGVRVEAGHWLEYGCALLPERWRTPILDAARRLRQSVARFWATLTPCPWNE